jgi:hypothetical protein
MTKQKTIFDKIEKLNHSIGKIEVCGVCGEVGNDLEFDEHMDRFVCCKCDVEREIGGI